MALTEFLLARIAEDERLARDADIPDWEVSARLGDEPMMARPASKRLRRVLAECEAKRRLVSEADVLHNDFERLAHCVSKSCRVVVRDRILTLLALPYADHPDYRDEWRA